MAKNMKATKHSKNYATYENAVKAAETAVGDGDAWYIIQAGTGELEGRFIPTFIGYSAIHFAHMGFYVVARS